MPKRKKRYENKDSLIKEKLAYKQYINQNYIMQR